MVVGRGLGNVSIKSCANYEKESWRPDLSSI